MSVLIAFSFLPQKKLPFWWLRGFVWAMASTRFCFSWSVQLNFGGVGGLKKYGLRFRAHKSTLHFHENVRIHGWKKSRREKNRGFSKNLSGNRHFIPKEIKLPTWLQECEVRTFDVSPIFSSSSFLWEENQVRWFLSLVWEMFASFRFQRGFDSTFYVPSVFRKDLRIFFLIELNRSKINDVPLSCLIGDGTNSVIGKLKVKWNQGMVNWWCK